MVLDVLMFIASVFYVFIDFGDLSPNEVRCIVGVILLAYFTGRALNFLYEGLI